LKEQFELKRLERRRQMQVELMEAETRLKDIQARRYLQQEQKEEELLDKELEETHEKELNRLRQLFEEMEVPSSPTNEIVIASTLNNDGLKNDDDDDEAAANTTASTTTQTLCTSELNLDVIAPHEKPEKMAAQKKNSSKIKERVKHKKTSSLSSSSSQKKLSKKVVKDDIKKVSVEDSIEQHQIKHENTSIEPGFAAPTSSSISRVWSSIHNSPLPPSLQLIKLAEQSAAGLITPPIITATNKSLPSAHELRKGVQAVQQPQQQNNSNSSANTSKWK
jgi:hypothetical protein